MASKQRYLLPSSTKNRRDFMHPIISTDVMGNRNVEVVPVGAWVEPCKNDVQTDAVLAAQFEEEKIRKIREEKENQLRSFQRQVKKRISRASQIKRQQQIQEAEKAFELERRVALHSFQTGDTARKNTCSVKQDLDHAIRQRLLEKYGEDVTDWNPSKLDESPSNVEESHLVADKARQQLASKKISQPNSQYQHMAKSKQSQKVSCDVQDPKVTTYGALPTTHASSTVGNDDADEEPQELLEESGEYEYDDKEEEATGNFSDPEDVRRAHFVQAPTKTGTKPRQRKSAPSKYPSSARLANVLAQFAESNVLASQRRQQAALSRRIFMDREREAVRESLRRQEHKKRIKYLKKEKEAYRLELEAQTQLELVDPVAREMEEEAELQQRLEEMHVQEMVDRRKEELRRTREMERYLDALRHSLVEKAQRQGIQLPSLCACGENLSDTYPETCANNCFFYKNHRAYARALQSLLSSIEVA